MGSSSERYLQIVLSLQAVLAQQKPPFIYHDWKNSDDLSVNGYAENNHAIDTELLSSKSDQLDKRSISHRKYRHVRDYSTNTDQLPPFELNALELL